MATKHETQQVSEYGVYVLYLFPTYKIRAEYKAATGQEAPGWNPYRAPKGWFDPAARQPGPRSILYPRVFIYGPTGLIEEDAQGQPVTEALALSRDEAANVNIPPTDTGSTNVPGADQEPIPVPVDELNPDEEFAYTIGGALVIRNKSLWQKVVEAGNFTDADRADLKAALSILKVLAAK